MTNKQIAQTWFVIIGLAFGWGFLCGITETRTEGVVLGVIQVASFIFTIWGMVRLWNSTPAASK